MKKLTLLFIIITFAFLEIQCSHNIHTEEFKRRLEFTDKNKNTKFKKKILDSIVEIGMTKEMVIASWGSSFSILKTPKSRYWNEQWRYNGLHTRYLYFSNDTLVSITFTVTP